jgi:ketosteroid isomerase-like protein
VLTAGSVMDVGDIAARLQAAFNAGDAAALASLYSETAVLMPPNEPMVRGRAGIQGWFEQALPRVGSVSITPIESTSVGDQAFQAGAFTSRSPAGAGSSIPDPSPARAGKYVLLLRRSAGHWKIECDIWSLDQPIG